LKQKFTDFVRVGNAKRIHPDILPFTCQSESNGIAGCAFIEIEVKELKKMADSVESTGNLIK
jgi:hypothetical protein